MRTPSLVVAAYHLRGGSRAALRASAVGVAAVIVVVGSAPEPARTVRSIVRGAVGPGVGLTGARLVLAAAALVLAATAARRVTLGLVSWMRSLPLSARDARRGAWLACTFTTLPLAIFLLAAVVLAPTLYESALSPARVLTLPLLLLAAGAASLRVAPAARGLALAALAAFAHGGWIAGAVGLLALGGWDRLAGELLPGRLVVPHRRARRTGATSTSRPRQGAHALALRWIARLLRPRDLVDLLLVPALPVAFAALVRANNPELGIGGRSLAARIGCAVALAIAAAMLAAPLLARRPPWPWLRTLPWSSRERVLLDLAAVALPLLALCVPVLLLSALDGTAHPALLATALATAACAAASVAAALRVGAHRQTGAVGETLVVALPLGILLALLPALAWAAPAIVALLVLLGARRERRSADVTRWNELRHGIEGDQGWMGRT